MMMNQHTRDKWVDYWNTKKHFFVVLDLLLDLVKDLAIVMILAYLNQHTSDKWVDYWNTKKHFFAFDLLNTTNNYCNILLNLCPS